MSSAKINRLPDGQQQQAISDSISFFLEGLGFRDWGSRVDHIETVPNHRASK